MILYNGFSPNGARVDIFMKEKGIEIPIHPINIMAGDTLKEEFLEINSLGEVPALQKDDGSVLTESVAICHYLESLYPENELFGSDADSKANIEMWNRRMELQIFNTIGDIGRHEFSFFEARGQVSEYAKFQRLQLHKKLSWLDGELSDGRAFIVGDRFSIADITGMAAIMLMMMSGYQIDAELSHVNRWVNAMTNRQSFPKLPTSIKH